MSELKISDLPAAAAVALTDVTLFDTGPTTKKATFAQVATALLGAFGAERVMAGVTSTTQSTFTLAGSRRVDMSAFPASIGALNRQVKLIVDGQKTSGATSVEVELFDVDNAIQVAGTNLVHSANDDLTELVSSALTVGSSAGNIRNDASTLYELNVKMNGGTPSDMVLVASARLQISYV